MKKTLSIFIFLFTFSSNLFAYEKKSTVYPWMASFNKAGQFNLDLSVGPYSYGLGILGGPEIIIGNYFPSGVPLQVGFAVKGLLGIGSLDANKWIEWGTAPLATIHWGVDLGGLAKLEWRLGIGLGISGASGSYGSIYNYTYGDYGLGFAIYSGIVWHFSPGFSVIIQGGYTGFAGAIGLGIQYNT